MTVRHSVDGVPAGSIPVTDSVVVRGDGCFEAIRLYGGKPFRLDDHLDRLDVSAASLQMATPRRPDLLRWIDELIEETDEGILRVLVTRGGSVAGVDDSGHCIVMVHPLGPLDETVSLGVVDAPWHAAGRPWDLAGAKTLSYAPNMAATRRARAEGFDDALLVDGSAIVLEGPTFSVAWVIDSVLMTPALNLGILDSITRRVVLGLAGDLEVRELSAPLEVLRGADEVFAMSTVKEVSPVTLIGESSFGVGEVTRTLATRFTELVRQELAD